jgi:thiamine biosynthesis lipoprotein
MGMPVTFDLRDPGADAHAADGAVAWLHHVDRTFSPFKPDSAISRLARGELCEDDADDEVREVLARCQDLKILSGGCFDVWISRASDAVTLDPSGYVKGWAVEAAANLLRAEGLRDFCLNAGGDLEVHGAPSPGRSWRVGIRHPWLSDETAAVLDVSDRAVATSGTYERGTHLLDPRSGRPAEGWVSLTVVGPRLGLVDAYATAAFVMGFDAFDWLSQFPGYEAFAISPDRRVTWTAGLEAFLASS